MLNREMYVRIYLSAVEDGLNGALGGGLMGSLMSEGGFSRIPFGYCPC